MSNLSSVVAQLREERNRIEKAIAALEPLAVNHSSLKRNAGTKRVMSAAARKRIAEAQRARWAKWKKQQKTAR